MSDKIEKVCGSLIQHGKYNDRIYLMKLSDNVSDTIVRLDEIIHDNKYSKIIAKIPEHARQEFEDCGYSLEAVIPRLYNGEIDGCFVGKYFSEHRKIERKADEIIDVLTAAQEKSLEELEFALPDRYTYSVADESDAEQISSVYRQVFESYPFPIHDKDYILQTMRENVVYFCVNEGNKIVSVASSEMDVESENVEMTDFATLPDYRGHGFAVFLLAIMEDVMRLRGIKTAYTIARALSYGMNITFAKLRYEYGGTLANNTNICGNMESMNIWHKPLVVDHIPEPEEQESVCCR